MMISSPLKKLQKKVHQKNSKPKTSRNSNKSGNTPLFFCSAYW